MRFVYLGLVMVVALGCAFFIFYTIRLFYVTRSFTLTRPGRGRAYLPAVVFPLLAVCFGRATRWSSRGARQE